MDKYIKKTDFKGLPVYEMGFDNYRAWFTPSIGGMVIRFTDEKRNYEIFHFNESETPEEIKSAPVLYGQTIMYLPNRLEDGKLKTTDSLYQFPINEKDLHNYLHGFLHQREYTDVKTEVNFNNVCVSASYTFDEKDEMFKYLPLKFEANVKYKLSEKGLEQFFTIKNLSDKMLPVGLGSHTSFNCTFSKGMDKKDSRIMMSVDKKVIFNEKRWLPTGEVVEADKMSKQFAVGEINPATLEIDNSMYTAVETQLNGKPFYGVQFIDDKTKNTVCYEVGREYKFWLCWNMWAREGFCCSEPMTWMVNAPNIDKPASVTGYKEIGPNEISESYQRIYSL